MVGPSGIFAMNCEKNPLSEIRYISSPNTTITYPTIIEVLYEEGGR